MRGETTGDTLRRFLELVTNRTNLFFGEAGVGKTNISLWLLSVLGTENPDFKFIYVGTEGSSYTPLIGRYRLHENVLFTTAYSSSDLFRTIVEVYVSYGSRLKMVVIDSVNSFYRSDAVMVPSVNKLLNMTLSLLVDAVIRKGLTCVLTAQVSASDEEVSASGISLLKYWCDNVFRLSRVRGALRELVLEYPVRLTLRYTIDGGGVRWVSSE